MTKDFFKDMFKYLPAQVVPGIVGFISIPIITRLFLPQDYGNYSLVKATVMILTTLLGWLLMSIIRFYPVYERDKKLEVFYGNIVKLGGISILIVTVLFCSALFTVMHHFSSNLYFLMWVGVGVFIFTAIFNIFQYFLRSKRQVRWFSGFAVWNSVISFGIGLGLIFLLKLGIEGMLWGITLSIGIILPLLWKKSIGGIPIIRTKIDFILVKKMMKYSFPLVVGNLAAWILSLSDRYILKFFRGNQEVGIYSASYNIAAYSIMLLVTLFMFASTPISMHIWEKEGKNKGKEFVGEITRFYFLVCFPAIVGLSVLSKPFINIMTGQEYFLGYKIIPFVTLGILFLGLQQRFQAGFLFYKKTSFIMFAIVASGLMNLGLNFLFIPKYGYMAAAITTLISYAFLLFIMIFGSRRIFIWNFPFKSLINSTCASAIMGIVVYYIGNSLTSSIPINLVVAIFIGVIIYFIVLILMNEFSPAEIQIFNFLKKRF